MSFNRPFIRGDLLKPGAEVRMQIMDALPREMRLLVHEYGGPYLAKIYVRSSSSIEEACIRFERHAKAKRKRRQAETLNELMTRQVRTR